MSNLRNVVYLTEAQLEELRTNGAVTVNGTTIEYSDSDLYITPLDDFDGIYAKEADLTAVESSVLDNAERIETLENQPVDGLVVQGKDQHNGDSEIYIHIPRNIREKLSSPWAAKITFVSLGDDITTLIQTISGEVDDSGEYKLIGTYGQDDGSEERCCRVDDDDFIIINLNNISGANVYEGYYYFYKIEFIC